MGGGLKRRASSILILIALVIVLLAYFTNAYAPEEEDEVIVKEGRLFHGILFLPLIPWNFGVETVGGVMSIVIPRLSGDPFKGSKLFTTSRDQQTNVTIKVFSGNSRLTNKCFLLGKFNLTGIPPAPRGTPRIEVTLESDQGTLIVKAEDKASGKSEKIEIPNNVPLTVEPDHQGTLIIKPKDKASGKSEKIEIPNDDSSELLEFMEREEMEEKKERERIVPIYGKYKKWEAELKELEELAETFYGKYKITNKLEAEAKELKELAETSTSDNETATAIAVDQEMQTNPSREEVHHGDGCSGSQTGSASVGRATC